MQTADERLTIRLARSEADLLAAQRLRYAVFIEEMGGDGPQVDHAQRLERDRFDSVADHLVLVDRTRDERDLGHVVGVYRLLPEARAAAAGGFYSEAEYDLALLRASGRPLLELGRSCVDRLHRGGPALRQLWSGVARYARERRIELVFGVASLPGTDPEKLAAPLSLLHHHHLAPPALRVRSRAFQRMDLMEDVALDRQGAMREVPVLIKAYLRLGGVVGEGAFVDAAFRTTDVCLILDVARIDSRASAFYLGAAD